MAVRTAIGLDIGTSSIRAAELSFGRGGVTLERFGQVGIPAGSVRDGEVVDAGAVSSAIRSLWANARFSHKRVLLGVANQRVVVRQVELPSMSVAERARSLPFQVQDFLPMPVEQAVMDFHPLHESVGEDGVRQEQGLLVAAVRDLVLANVTCVQQAGLKPVNVDLTSFALLRAVRPQGAFAVATEAVVDVGAKITNIVVHAGGSPRFVRILLTAGADVTEAVADRLGVPTGEAEAIKLGLASTGAFEKRAPEAVRAVEATATTWAQEVRSSLDYAEASAGLPVERVVLTGGGSQLWGLADRLSDLLRIPVVAGDPLDGLHIGHVHLDDHQLRQIRPLAAVPVGLALGAAA